MQGKEQSRGGLGAGNPEGSRCSPFLKQLLSIEGSIESGLSPLEGNLY